MLTQRHIHAMACAAEELAELERQRLEALETQRRRRQEGEEGASEDEEGEEGGPGAGALDAAGGPLPAGGYAARRAKRARAEERGARRLGEGASGDALEDDWATGSDSEGSGEWRLGAVAHAGG